MKYGRINMTGTMPNSKLIYNQFCVQYTVPVKLNTVYCMNMIKNRPSEFAIPARSIDFHSNSSLKRIAALTLREFAIKKTRKNGKDNQKL